MLDIKLFRENPGVVEENLRKRGMDTSPVKEIIALDEMWRKKLFRLDSLRKERNELSQKVAKGKKSLLGRAKELKVEIEKLEREVPELKEKRDRLLMRMPNILHPEVPKGKDDSENVPVRYWGKPMVKKGTSWDYPVEPRWVNFDPLDHIDLLVPRYADIERAAKVSGARFYYLKGKLVELESALLRFALDYLKKKGFTIVEPPFMIRERAMRGVTDFTAFEDTLYRVEGEDLYMIATAEHPLASLHMDEILDGARLPLKYAGISPCFRKEAGSHGRDTKGIFRVHQFNKVEQFIFCKPEESWELHEKITRNIEEIFRKLEIPHRVVEICTGDIGYVAARKYDLEAWLPGQGKFREMGSSSNCTDWQSRGLNIRYRSGGDKQFVHTLNNTAIATPRAAIAVVENFQQEDGSIKIPKVLHKYLDFKEM